VKPEVAALFPSTI